MSDTPIALAEPIPYARPDIGRPSRVAPAVWLAIVGLALIFFGGCFLIGVMMVLYSSALNSGMTPLPNTASTAFSSRSSISRPSAASRAQSSCWSRA